MWFPGVFSVLQVNFNLQRHTGYFLIQVYVPCILIVVLSWVSFWIHREATSDRVGLGMYRVAKNSTTISSEAAWGGQWADFKN
jgi:gamma-aminobutyric acid receptor subunit alpha